MRLLSGFLLVSVVFSSACSGDAAIQAIVSDATLDGLAFDTATEDAAGEDGVPVDHLPGDVLEPADLPMDVDETPCAVDGAWGCPCVDNSSCSSGWCVPTGEGSQCTKSCYEDCPDGWSCNAVSTPGGDPVFICLPLHTNLCRPCGTGEDCMQLGGTGGYCLEHADGSGSFCGSPCSESAPCPAGFDCLPQDIGADEPVDQCVPKEGVSCSCNALAAKEEATTDCSSSNEVGTCHGSRFCSFDGLTECSAPDPFAEICNLEDDDCNGEVDEGLGVLTCGEGICATSVPACVDGIDNQCLPAIEPGSLAETCDGIDNDCDGDTDEAVANPAETPCATTGVCAAADAAILASCDLDLETGVAVWECDYNGVAGYQAEHEDGLCDGLDNDCDGETDEDFPLLSACDGDDTDLCAAGVFVCDPADPTAVVCAESAEGGIAETCDGLDNDCDGEVDEDFLVKGMACDGLDADFCAFGTWTCAGNGLGVECVNEAVLSVPEVCDGLDNDCDGIIDELQPQLSCGQGVCAHTIPSCSDGSPQGCDPFEGASAEICDGLDNDCDGLIDEGQPELACGLGICDHKQPSCVEGVPQICDPIEGATDELCDGFDNDCDGAVDEDFGDLGKACDGDDGDLCAFGSWTCSLDGQGLECLNEAVEDIAEVCDGVDNDCDGETDEGQPELACGQGVCAHTTPSCADGNPVACNPFEGASPEICDGADNDCDGVSDEDQLDVSCGQGLCAHTIASCVDGEAQVCDAFQGAAEEICDGLDNDCDGSADEDLPVLVCGEGVCAHQSPSCVDGASVECDPFAGAGAEVCDGLDNDCDGIPDEDFANKGEACDGDDLDLCAFGTWSCTENGGGVECVNEEQENIEEICDELDNDCDGEIDEGGVCPIFQDDFEDGDLSPWKVVHGNNEEGEGGLNGDGYDIHVSPGAVVDTGMPPNSKVFISTNVTVFEKGCGLTMKRNGDDFCGFFVYGNTAFYLAADSPEEQGQGSLVSFTEGVPFLLEAELDGTQLKVWMDGELKFEGNHPQCDFDGTGEVGTLHHSGSVTTYHDFYVEWE